MFRPQSHAQDDFGSDGRYFVRTPTLLPRMSCPDRAILRLTNDGNAILREIDVAHPAAKNMIELSRTQDEECGDGTTSVIILGEFLPAPYASIAHGTLPYTYPHHANSGRNPCTIPRPARARHPPCCDHFCVQQGPPRGSRDYQAHIHPYRR